MYLLDTNILSELRKRQKNQGVVDFFAQVEAQKANCYISVISLGEIQSGINKLRLKNDNPQADNVQKWLSTIHLKYQSHKLDFDENCALKWASLTAKNPHNSIDKQIASTALVHDLILVTRNIKDFKDTGIKLYNPFS